MPPSPSPAARAGKAARARAGQVSRLCPERIIRCTVTLRDNQAGELAALISVHPVPLASLCASADLAGGQPGPGRPWAGMASGSLHVWWLGPWPDRAVVSQHPAANPHGAARARPRPSRVPRWGSRGHLPMGGAADSHHKGVAIRRGQQWRTFLRHLLQQ